MRIRRQQANKLTDKHRGQGMVEMALILPVLLLIVLGLIEFGRAFFFYTMVSNGAREGARYGMVHSEEEHWPAIEQAVFSRMFMIPTDTVEILIAYDNLVEGEPVEGHSRIVVDVSVPFSMMTPLFQPIFPPTEINFVSARTIVPGTRVHPEEP